MATQFQNRLIGTVILVSLGIIFLPDLLTGKPAGTQEPIASVPLRPEAQAANPEVVLPAGATAQVSAAGATAGAESEQWTVEETAQPLTLGGEGPAANQVVAGGAVSQPQPVTLTPAPPIASQPQAKLEPAATATTATAAPKAEPVPAPKPFTPQVKPFVPEIKPLTEVIAAKPTATTVQSRPAQPAFNSSAWVIQVGVFSNTTNAQALVSRLRAAGLPASVRSWSSGGTQLSRVTVGPDVSKSKLEGMLSRVNQIGGTAGKVVAYNPQE